MKDVVRVVIGSSGGNAEHLHEDFLGPEEEANECTKKIKRRLKHANGQLYATQYPATMNMSRASVDILDQEMNLFELKQMLKISKDCVRKNYFKHMHGAPKPAPNEQTPNGYN